eukprot:Skav221857  [mRNA]  locus=scaffold1175:124034:145397:+ [translate_table: standard]
MTRFLLLLPVALATDHMAELETLRNLVLQQEATLKDQQLRIDKAEEQATKRRLQDMTPITEAELNATIEAINMDFAELGGAMDSAWLCLCGALVMFMHAGFAMLETGSCRAKNASNVLMKNLVNVCVGTLGWYATGWAFAFGTQTEAKLFGTTGWFGLDFYTKDSSGNIMPVEDCKIDGCQSTMLMWFFQWAFCTAGATIVSGAVAERVKAYSFGGFAFVMTAFIYPWIVAWTWGGGWLNGLWYGVGFMDFAGSGIVHLTGGAAGLAGTIILGPRKGRFKKPEEFEPHNVPLVVFGTFALWFGWYGFNPGWR